MNKLVLLFKDGTSMEFECHTKEKRAEIIATVSKTRLSPYENQWPNIKSWFRTAQDGSILEEG